MRGAVLAAALLAGTLSSGPLPGSSARAYGGVFQHGRAVYYGGRPSLHTRLTTAHRTLPLGTWVRVTHRDTGRSVDVMINDRGPFGNAARVIDLSRTAAARLGILAEGVAPVTVTVLTRR